jgi:hypothetical protein
VLSGRELETAVLDSGVVDAHERGQEERGEDRPARLLILMRLEAGPARHLEVDLVLEERHRPTEQGRGDLREPPREQRAEALVVRLEILDAVPDSGPRLGAVRLPVDHVTARHFRPGGELIGPRAETRGLRGREQPGEDEETVACVAGALLG